MFARTRGERGVFACRLGPHTAIAGEIPNSVRNTAIRRDARADAAGRASRESSKGVSSAKEGAPPFVLKGGVFDFSVGPLRL